LKRFHSSLSMKLAIQHSKKKWLNHYLPLDFFSGRGRTGKYCAMVLLSVAIAILGDFKMGFHVDRQSVFLLQWIMGRYMSSVKEGIRQGDFLFFKRISVLFLGRHMQKSKKSNLHSSFIHKNRIKSPELNSRAKLCSQAVNLPGARPLMNPMECEQGTSALRYLKHFEYSEYKHTAYFPLPCTCMLYFMMHSWITSCLWNFIFRYCWKTEYRWYQQWC